MQQRRLVRTQLCSRQGQNSAPEQGVADQALRVQVVNTQVVNSFTNNIVNVANSNQQVRCTCCLPATFELQPLARLLSKLLCADHQRQQFH